MAMKRLTIIAVVLLVGLAGCTGGGTDATDNSDVTGDGAIVFDDVGTGDNVIRFIDREAGTVCYYFAHPDGYAGQGGLSCMPIENTNFAEET